MLTAFFKGLFSRRRREDLPPTILPIPRRTIEQVENELCAVRQQLRESRKAAGEAFATSANMRHRLDQAEARAKDCRQAVDDLIAARNIDADRIRELRELIRRLIAELRIHRGDKALASMRFSLLPVGPGIDPAIVSGTRVGFLLDDSIGGGRAAVAVWSSSRRTINSILNRVLARQESAPSQTQAEAKS